MNRMSNLMITLLCVISSIVTDERRPEVVSPTTPVTREGESESFLLRPSVNTGAGQRRMVPSGRILGSRPRANAGSRFSSTVVADANTSMGETSQSPLCDLKDRLLRASAGVNRGLSCLEDEQKAILKIVEELESKNPNPNPNDGFANGKSLLAGEWKLLFTSALDVLSLGLLPGIEVGQIFQNINDDGTEIANVVDLQPKAGSFFKDFLESTSARLTVLAASGVEGDKRITLSFRSSQYSPRTLLGLDVSSTLPALKIKLPKFPRAGWIDTTYLDEDIRVARAFGGNLFVLVRE